MTDAQSAERRKWLALVLLAMAQFMVVVDASITNVALPSIGEALRIEQDDLSWVVNAYVLVFGGFLLLGGRMADFLGRRLIFMAGLVLFALASLVGGFSESQGMIIAARAVQGLGGALMSPAALSILQTTFTEGAERNRALGVWSPARVAPSACSWAVCSPTGWAGSGSCGSTSRSASAPRCSSRGSSPRAGSPRPPARSTPRAPCRSPPAWPSSSTRSSTPTTRAGARPRRSGCWRSPPRSSRPSSSSSCARPTRSCPSASSATGR